jgi:hypothetical protein
MIYIIMDIQDNMNYIDIDEYLRLFYKESAKKEQQIRLKRLRDTI